MRRLLPQPLMSVALVAAWVLAHNRVTVATLLLGGLLGVALPLLTARFWPEYPRRVAYGALLRLTAVVAFDIAVANVRVAALILGPRRRLHPRFVVVPLALTSPYSITLLASIISLTRGAADQGALRTPTAGDLRMLTLAVQIAVAMMATALLLNLYRLLRGPRAVDRVIALDTAYINTVALLVLLGVWRSSALYFEAAVVIALLGFVGTLALCKLLQRGALVE
jgi:multisubunit Na+/H+ antiporter MnhF subunit/multisubunit Na+/H+ antiporter MnhE subunit